MSLSSVDIMRSPFMQSSMSRPTRRCCSSYPRRNVSLGLLPLRMEDRWSHPSTRRRIQIWSVAQTVSQCLRPDTYFAVTRCDVNFSLNMASCVKSAFGFFAVRNIPRCLVTHSGDVIAFAIYRIRFSSLVRQHFYCAWNA